MLYYLALGSNLGDRLSNIEEATDFLNSIGKVLKVSSIYETLPVGMEDGAGNFYNLVLLLESNLSPHELLKAVKGCEKKMGRDISSATASHNKPRSMDIDILLAEDRIIENEVLSIPHKEMHRREFVLVPLNEIAPAVIHPVLNQCITEILSRLTGQSPGMGE
jgi:2-amino-4-hydroxy-6-hydroxymethyldihydropteridine diphosphokinase